MSYASAPSQQLSEWDRDGANERRDSLLRSSTTIARVWHEVDKHQVLVSRRTKRSLLQPCRSERRGSELKALLERRVAVRSGVIRRECRSSPRRNASCTSSNEHEEQDFRDARRQVIESRRSSHIQRDDEASCWRVRTRKINREFARP